MSTPNTGCTTTPSLIDRAAQRFNEKLYIEDGDTTLSFAEFQQGVRKVAASLIANDIQLGDRVALWAPNSWQWIVAAYGIQYAGGVLVTLNTRYKGAEAAVGGGYRGSEGL